MSTPNPAPNLVGITGIARRLVMDGALAEADARRALEEATKAKKALPLWLSEKKLVGRWAPLHPAHGGGGVRFAIAAVRRCRKFGGTRR